jgi:hypothetical protein
MENPSVLSGVRTPNGKFIMGGLLSLTVPELRAKLGADWPFAVT